MGTVRKTIFFILTPIFVVMLGAAVWYHLYGSARAEETANRQLGSAAELTARLILRHVAQVEGALDSIIVQGHLQHYHMYSQVGLLDEAEDARLWVEQALERLARAHLNVDRIECYTRDGDRFVAVVDGRRVLNPLNAKDEPWFSQALNGEEYLGFHSQGLLRLAEARQPEYSKQPIAVVSIVFDVRDAATEATKFATRHLNDVRVSLVHHNQSVHFERGSLPGGNSVLRRQAPLKRFEATVLVEQTRSAALADFHRGRNILFSALAIITVGLLVVCTLGTHQVVKDLREANRQTDEANRALAASNRGLQQALGDLVVARDAAEAGSRAKSEFLANMSHEIRTPLNAVIGMTELTLDGPLSESQRDYLRIVLEEGGVLLGVINDILDFSKIEAGRFELDPAPFPLRDVVGDTMKSLAFRAHAKDLELACRIDPAIPERFEGDSGRLRQILTNLVGNAVKFTERGEVLLSVEPVSAPGGGPFTLHFSVHDTGIGIAPEKLEAIFEEFRQADMSSTREHGGTGLGLTISSRLVELMGGRVWVESKLGQGSTFHFTIQLAVCDADTDAAWRRWIDQLRGTRVLIVDDNLTNQRILAEMVGSRGMRPTTASSAAEALRLLEEAQPSGDPFRVVLSDLNMPTADGFELAASIRRQPSLAPLEIILLTSTAAAGDLARCEQLGIRARLMKPIKQLELITAVARALGLAAAGPQPPLPGQTMTTGPLRLLLVEDSIPNQKLALAMLEKAGHTVVVANHGKEALAVLAAQEFDLVLMDVQMPVMDGLETTRAVRDTEQRTGGHVPIVAMTAHALKGDRERCLQAGMDGYVTKPINRDALFAEIDAARGGASGPHAETTTTSPAEGPIPWSHLLDLVGGDRQVLADIVRAYLDESRQNMRRIAQAIRDQDAAALRHAAHQLKSSLRFFHAAAGEAQALELEMLGKQGDFTGAEALFVALQQELQRLNPELVAFCAE